MSLILDALNRSREDANQVPGLATHHPVETVTAERRQYQLWVALAIAVVVIAWLLMELYSPSPAAVSEVFPPSGEITPEEHKPGIKEVAAIAESLRSNAVPADMSPAATVATEPSAGRKLEAAPVFVQDEQINKQASVVAPEYQYAETTVAGATTPGTPVTDAEQEYAAMQEDSAIERSTPPAENDAVAELYQNPGALDEQAAARASPRATESPAKSAAGEALDVDKILRLAREEVENASLGDHPVPFLIDLSQQIKDSIPSVYYLRHDYSSNTAQSSVVLNSKTLQVGGSPASGMKIEEILPDSVVLNYQGTQFRLRALNSWVNL